MSLSADLSLVFTVGLVTGLATGLGVAPFFVVRDLNDRWLTILWGLAVGVLAAATLFGLIGEGLAAGPASHVLLGVLGGVAFVLLADRVVAGYEFSPRTIAGDGDEPSSIEFRTVVLTVGVLTLHSIPEGIAVGVAFADPEPAATVEIAGITLPALAVFMGVAISILNVPADRRRRRLRFRQ